MSAPIVLLVLVAVFYFLANAGSKEKVSLKHIAIPLVVIALVVYVAWPVFAPLANWLMQVGSHLGK